MPVEPTLQGMGGGRQWSGEAFGKVGGYIFSLGTGRDCRKTSVVYASDRNIPVLKRQCPFAASHPWAMQNSAHVSRCTGAMSSRKRTWKSSSLVIFGNWVSFVFGPFGGRLGGLRRAEASASGRPHGVGAVTQMSEHIPISFRVESHVRCVGRGWVSLREEWVCTTLGKFVGDVGDV